MKVETYRLWRSLDKKFFYTTSRRNKIKVLHRGEREEENAYTIKHPKIISQCFSVKSMFLGVVGRPIPRRAFTGKILFERVPESIEVG